MKHIATLLLGFGLSALLSFTITNTEKKDCSIMREGTFYYGAGNEEVEVLIKGDDHTEYHQGGKYIIKSEMKWLNDCEYNMTMTEITIPKFPYKPGDVMNVKINKVKGNEIFYTATVKTVSWKGKFTKAVDKRLRG